jgi:putative transposase
MEKIINHPVFFTATIKEWKKLLKPEKYKQIILKQLHKLVENDKIIPLCLLHHG